MRPRTSWIIAAFCLALLCGAMAWTTHSMLKMEDAQGVMSREATVQELARLALWRMETVASRLVTEESRRPPEEYRPFAEPEALVDNKTNSTVTQGDLLTLSRVLREPSEYVLLHFEMDATGAIRSPQVPQGQDLMICQSIGFPSSGALKENSEQFTALCSIMDRSVSTERLKTLRTSLKLPAQLRGNRAWIWDQNEKSAPLLPPPTDNAPPQTAQTRIQKPEGKTEQVQQQIQAPLNGYAQQAVTWKPEQAKAQQSEFNNDEAQARADLLKQGTGKAAARRAVNNLNVEEISKKFSKEKESNTPKPSSAITKVQEKPPAPSAPPVVTRAAVTAAGAGATPSSPVMSEFLPLWLGDALILTRRVSKGGREWIQGVWLDWNKLHAEFNDAVEDRLPDAKIVPAPDPPPAGAHLLASLPVQLIPGALTFAPEAFWTPLKVSLGIAWLCVLVAVAAVALVLRGMMALSERRASFVSSVTHELRTPLATFKLYSEMLADGMVKEETKKQQYLETLTGEADRLGHLVENVLSYSRIERGKGPAAASAVPVSELLHRIEPRLNQRALMAGMDFSVNAPPEVTALALRTDAGAVEQILCNLVDNACKYGRRDGVPGHVELVVTKERRRICFAVRDHGPGIAHGEEKKLFLPFHKSAREAAHSKPGVGLGLALCRRLATELRGTLDIDRSWRQGASFVLKLPV
ncbi:MAG TPA: HAMP domain-containing sensor histidine kinase [Verrucomicrobiales bacterium]|nr:HAMP domain-containing sensor histidine kinase [Verrucomicrobiales bacterium]